VELGEGVLTFERKKTARLSSLVMLMLLTLSDRGMVSGLTDLLVP